MEPFNKNSESGVRQIAASVEKRRHTPLDKIVRQILFVLFCIISVFSILNVFFPHLFWEHFSSTNYTLHSAIEALGAISAILMAFMPLQIIFGRIKPSYIFLSLGFFSMGLWDLFHSFFEVGHGFVFTHSIALLSGGFFFALFVFPWKEKIIKVKTYLFILIALISLAVLIPAVTKHDILPNMVVDGSFTQTSKVINLLAGALFLISVIKLLIIYYRQRNTGIMILLFVALLSAIAGITFQYSEAWTDNWWLWHYLRLIAFLSVLGYVFWQIQAISNERNRALQNLNEQHKLLAENEERLRLINQATKQGLWDWNVPENKVYFSPTWKMQIGYKDDELENDFDNWIKLLHPEDKDRCLQTVDDFLKNPQDKFILEFRFRHKDGHYVWIHNQAAAVLNEDGSVKRMFGAHTDITEQKEAIEKLRESEAQFRIVFEESPLGKSQTGTDGSLNINKAFSDITGYNVEELQKRHWKEITHPDDIKESEEVIQSLLAGKSNSEQFEKRYLHKDGHYVWTEVNTTLHRDADGNPLFFITTINDISKRKQMEVQLVQNEQRFKQLFLNDPSAIFIGDPQTGLLVDVNPAAEKLMEMTRDELIGLHQSELHPEEIKAEQAEKFKKLQGKPDVSVDSMVLTKSGKRKPVEIKVSMVEMDNKPYLIGIFHDVSKLMEQQQQIKQSEEKHRAIFESATDAFIIVSPEGTITETNPAACRIYGYKHEEMVGMKTLNLIHPDSQHKFREFNEMIKQTGHYIGETVDVRKDGSTFNTEVRGSVINFNNKMHLLGIVRDVSEKKKAQQKILESEEKFRSLFNSVSIPLCHVKADGRIESINNRFLEVLGYNLDDIPTLDDWWIKAYPDEEYRAWVINNWDKAVQKSIKNHTDIKSDIYDVSCKNGEIRQMIIAGITIEKDTLATFIDVTEQQKAEKAIIHEKEFSDNVINTLPGIFYLFNQEGKFIKWNNTLAGLSGLSFNEVGKKSPLDFIAPHHRDKVQEAIQSAFIEGKVFVEADFLAKGRKNIPYYFTGIRIVLNDEPLLLGVGIDITQRKNAELEREKALLNLNERVKEITCLFEINEVIKNSGENTSSTINNIVNIIPNGWQYPEKTGAKIELNGQAFSSREYKESPHFIEQKIIQKGIEVGKLQVSVFDLDEQNQKTPFIEEEKQLLENIAYNIGYFLTRTEAEKQLKKTLDDLTRSNKELEQFAYVASHDLQEPLRMVSSYTQMLQRRYEGKLDEKADKYIFYAVDGASRMQNLINDLLEFSRISTRGEEFRLTDSNQILQEVIEQMKIRIAETKAQITYDKLPAVVADSLQIERLFSNLIGNALKFSKPGVKPKIHISCTAEKGEWKFSVADNGIGIKDNFQEKVFVIFQRLHGAREYPGTGIGLAICKQIVQRHGGKIWFESEENKGTTFFFTLKKNKLAQ